jgi:hypothetical protein
VTALLGIVLITILALAVVSRADTKPKPDPPPLTSSALYEAECGSAWRAVRFYRSKVAQHRHTLGVSGIPPVEENASCIRLRDRAGYWRGNAFKHGQAVIRFRAYHYNWRQWLPDKWQRVGACETGYGKRPGRWDWNSGTYQGAFGFYHGSWDTFVSSAATKAGPYPSEAYLATPRQQYEVALAIYRRYGFSGWGCRGA